jgi:hypothetical protein
VSNFDQTVPSKECMRVMGCRALEAAMSIADEFWQNAKEAILSAAAAKNHEDRQGLPDLVRTRTQAALQERQCIPLSIQSSPSAKGTRHVL